ncbi:M20 family metallopeptidase [Pseudomonas sp. nanlin1]|uniref:M20 family metallopeptidase n=1 Tax=Pseudomonas sp. nanlin1 TaxID=3040605 RepID=UPI00388FA872
MSTHAALQQALESIEADHASMVNDLQRMIAVDTCFPPGSGYSAFADLMETLVAPLGLQTQRVTVPQALWQTRNGEAYGERINLIARQPGDGEVCSLYFHVDTVPPGDGWTQPPLQLTEVDGQLIGRGTADMKGSVAATLAALRAAQRFNLPLRFCPSLLLCTDEEGGLYPGIRYLAEQQLIEGHILSFNGGAAPRIWAGCFGSVDLKIVVKGRSSHSGEPVDAINAIEQSLPLLNALHSLKQQVQQRAWPMPSPPHYQGAPLISRMTLAAAHGGSKGSTVPAQFEILINRRYAPQEPFEAVMAELRACIDTAMAGSEALSVEHEVIGHLAPVADPTGPHWPRWQAALGVGFGFSAEQFQCYGSSSSSDMGWVQQAGIQEILLGGLIRPQSRIHAADEYTTRSDLVALAQSILAYLAADFAPPAIAAAVPD